MATAQPAKNAKRILIIDDEKPIARTLSIKLSAQGFEARVAEDGQTALEIIGKEKFDLIILDLLLPIIDGFTVLSEIRKKGIKTPITIVTNLSQPEDITRAKELGADDYFISSDVSMADVVQYIKKSLEK